MEAGAVLVEDVRVVEDEAARSHHEPDGKRACAQQLRGHAQLRDAEAEPATTLQTADPEEARDEGEQHRDGAPVGLEPETRPEEGPEAIHVRVSLTDVRSVSVEIVLHAELAHEQRKDEQANDEHVAHVLVVHKRVDEQGDDAEQDVVDPAQPEERLDVEPDLELEISTSCLADEAGEHDDC